MKKIDMGILAAAGVLLVYAAYLIRQHRMREAQEAKEAA